MKLFDNQLGMIFRHRILTSNCQFLLKRRAISTTNSLCDSTHEPKTGKLIYEGKLTKRILYLKSVSVISSLGLAGSYGYVISQKGFSVALAGVGFAFTPFLLSPIVIAWFFKRYITQLYYDADTQSFTAHHYGLLLNKKKFTFTSDQVVRSDFTSMLNSFTVANKPFFIHDEDLVDLESIDLYKRMLGLDQLKVDQSNNKDGEN